MSAAALREAADFGPLLRRWQDMLRDPVVQERLAMARYLELRRLISLGEGLLILPNPGTAKGPSGAEVCQELTTALAKIYTSTPGGSELWHTSATLAALRTLDGSAFDYDATTEVLTWREQLERRPKKQGKSTAQMLAGLREGLKIDFAVLMAGAEAPPSPKPTPRRRTLRRRLRAPSASGRPRRHKQPPARNKRQRRRRWLPSARRSSQRGWRATSSAAAKRRAQRRSAARSRSPRWHRRRRASSATSRAPARPGRGAPQARSSTPAACWPQPPRSRCSAPCTA